MSCKLRGSWSSNQAATPIGESAMPYSVCGCDAMKTWVGMVLYRKASVSYACFSSAESPDGGGLPAAAALLISGGITAGRFVCMPINSGWPCVAIKSVIIAPQSPPCATYRVYPRRFISTAQARALRRGLDPIALRRPTAGEHLHRRERHAVRRIGDGLFFGPPRCVDPLAEIREVLVRGVTPKGADGVSSGLS